MSDEKCHWYIEIIFNFIYIFLFAFGGLCRLQMHFYQIEKELRQKRAKLMLSQ